MKTPHQRLLAQIRKAQAEMAKWPKAWRKGLKLDLIVLEKPHEKS